MAPVIRAADDRDLPALVRQFGSAQFLRRRLDLQRDGHGVLLIALADDVPVGHVYLWLACATEPEIRAELPGVPLLNRLVVAAEHRNNGIGTRLLVEAERRLRYLGYDRVALGVRVDNHDAIRLYQRLGYRRWRCPPIVAQTGGDLGNGGEPGQVEIFTVFVKWLGAGGAPAASHLV
jgi:ribosomal protein S18 acetylase RimI-like enzyme